MCNGFQVIERTRFCDGQTDRRTDSHKVKTICLPTLAGGGIHNDSCAIVRSNSLRLFAICMIYSYIQITEVSKIVFNFLQKYQNDTLKDNLSYFVSRTKNTTWHFIGIIHFFFSCINICRGSKKLFEPEAARPRVQTISKSHG